jgi:hypothetical protein
MDQPGAGNLSGRFVPSLQVGDFMNEDGSEQGQTAMPNFGANRQLSNFGLSVFCSAEDPWNHQLLNASSNGQLSRFNQTSVPYYQNTTYNFSDYRSAGLPSDCGTLPPDSGYGSHRPKHSIASNSSVHDDDGTLDFQLTDRFGHLSADNSQLTPPVLAHADLKFRCQECNSRMRTRSELNKHMQRHRKPYHCSHPTCPRRGEGFSTKNDLARHKKSVHKELEGNGNVYICREGPCAGKSKLWPRADNFRQHLTRVHQRELKAEDDLSAYVHQSSPLREDLKGVGSSVPHLDHQMHPQELTDQSDIFQTVHERAPQLYQPLADLQWPQLSGPITLSSQQSENALDLSTSQPSQGIQQGILADLNCEMVTRSTLKEHQDAFSLGDIQSQDLQDNTKTSRSPESPFDPDTSDNGDISHTIDLSDDSNIAAQDEPKPPVSAKSGKSPANTGQETQDGAFDLALAAISNAEEVRRILASLPTAMLESVLKERGTEGIKQDMADEKSSSKPQNQCTECSKTFNRPCELKKHIKRHEKPYGCTFRDCQKEFGSKNDWKRHESSQHLQLETWNCEEEECRKVCHRREGFKNHLQRDHNLEDAKVLEEKLERCRMGRHCDPRFWCGFCVDVVEIPELGVNAWMKRCDHIDNHLMGKEGLEKKRSRDWKHMEDQQPQSSPEPRTPGTSKPAASTSQPSKTVNRRRKASQDRSSQPSKRSRGNTIYMWRCVSDRRQP